MHKKYGKAIAFLLAAVLVFGIIPSAELLPSAFAATYSGKCGDNAKCSFDTSTGVLKITGTGAMYDFFYESKPWEGYKQSVKTIKIGNGITVIGRDAFYDFDSLKSVIFGTGVKEIQEFAFLSCDSLESLTLPEKLETLNYASFGENKNLKSVTIPGTLKDTGSGSFVDCTELTSLTISEGVKTVGTSFVNCSSLTSVTLPESVTSVSDGAFNSCDSLKKVTVRNPSCKINGLDTFPQTTVLYGYKNSTAEAYAANHNLSFHTITCGSSHQYSTKWTTDKKATCTDKGSKSHHCLVCGAKKNITEIPKKDHSYGSYVPVKKATRTADGTKKKTCSVCGKTYTVTVKKASKISLTTSSYAYTGENRTIKYAVKDSSGKTLVKGTDYTVSYPTGRKSIGKHTVKITLKGKYSGTKTLNFTIKPAKVTGLKRAKESGYDLKLQWSSVKGAEKYQVQYYNQNKKAWETIGTTEKLSLKMKKLPCDYKWRIRAYKTVSGTKYYGTYSDAFITKA